MFPGPYLTHCQAVSFLLLSNRLFPGERMVDEDVDNILKWTDTNEDLDGNLKYEGTSQRYTIIGHVTLVAITRTLSLM